MQEGSRHNTIFHEKKKKENVRDNPFEVCKKLAESAIYWLFLGVFLNG